MTAERAGDTGDELTLLCNSILNDGHTRDSLKFYARKILDAPRPSTLPLGWVIAVDDGDGAWRVSDPVYRTREGAEADAKLPQARGLDARVAGVYIKPPSHVAAPTEADAALSEVEAAIWETTGSAFMSGEGGKKGDRHYFYKTLCKAGNTVAYARDLIRSERPSATLTPSRNDVLEEAAQRCDGFAKTGREMSAEARKRNDDDSASSSHLQSLAAESCAGFIRSLKSANVDGGAKNG